jgi:hypothetical protein
MILSEGTISPTGDDTRGLIPCKYVIARFVPDELRDERINVGIILLALPTGEINYRFANTYERMARNWPNAHPENLRPIVSALEKEVRDIHEESNLSRLSNHFKHQLQFSEVRGVLASNAEDELNSLYRRIVDDEPSGVPSYHFEYNVQNSPSLD